MTYLQPLLNSKEYSHRFHWWFAIFLETQYVNNLNYVKYLHQLNKVETWPLATTIKKYLSDYAVEDELTHN